MTAAAQEATAAAVLSRPDLFVTAPGGERTATLERRAHELSRRLFRRWVWSLGWALAVVGMGLPGRMRPRRLRPARISGDAIWRVQMAAADAGPASGSGRVPAHTLPRARAPYCGS